MAKRKKIALLFSYDEGWIAGAYYVMNLVHALKTLPDDEMPSLTICAITGHYLILKNETNYPYLKHYNTESSLTLPLHKRVVNVINRLFFDRNIFDPRLNHYDVDFIYPCYGSMGKRYDLLRKVYWVPDYQEKYYPQFFSERDLVFRTQLNNGILYNNNYIVLSSKTVQNDVSLFFPHHVARSFVLPFAVTLPGIESILHDAVTRKFNLPHEYFFCPNQFWQHKNHITVLRAIALLKQRGVRITVLFSGKEEEPRNRNYVQSLKDFAVENDIRENVMFLGFLDRREQLCILKNSISVVQPSLFEGWSTVVEDCKALNTFIILSDIHKEQISQHCAFFGKEDAAELAILMEKYLTVPPPVVANDYSIAIQSFASNFLDIARNVDFL